MTYRTAPHRLPAVREVLRALSDARCLVLTTHLNADGDGVGSQVALASWFRSQGGEAWIINPTPFPDLYGFLLTDPSWTLDPGSNLAKEVSERADLAIVLDTGEVPRIGRVWELIEGVSRVVIDHHPPGPRPISGLSFRDTEACATGELVYDLLAEAGEPLAYETALGLYVAVLTDTGSFRFSNTTVAAHELAAVLLERGIDPEKTWRLVYGNAPMRKLRLLEASLGELVLDRHGDLAWMTVPADVYQALGAIADDLEGLVDYPRGIEGVEVGLLFRETARGATKVSFRSNGPVDVNALARKFGGGGHVKASGAVVDGSLPKVREEVLAAVRTVLRERRQDARG